MLHLGVDLILGSLVNSRQVLDPMEYASVVSVTLVVSFMGFVEGNLSQSAALLTSFETLTLALYATKIA
jgi:hypothetical protein